MKITIDKVFEKNNTSRYWLAKEVGVTYISMKKLCDNKTSSLNFDIQEKICKALGCTPNDIFEIE